jgi:uncharacterized Zn finger protein
LMGSASSSGRGGEKGPEANRMRSDFGKTWWGKAWVHALEHLGRHYANRLPRGRLYARGGHVLSLRVSEDGIIHALVQGTRRTPYSVVIGLRHLTDEEKLSLAKRVIENPFMLAELLSGNLPEGLGPLILPSREDEFDTYCSCPDWANPCKHIASVLYILANEIDRDPFILFRVRGIEPEGFKREVIGHPQKPPDRYISAESVEEPLRLRKALAGMDLSLDEKVGDKLFSLLVSVPETIPSAVGENLREILARARKLPEEEALSQAWRDTDILFRVEGETMRPLFYKKGKKQARGFPEDIYRAWAVLQSLVDDRYLTDTVRFASVLSRFASSLLEAGHIIPRAIRERDSLRIEWAPLIMGKSEGILRRLSEACPLGMFPISKGRFALPDEGIRLFLTRVITDHIARVSPSSDGFLSSREPMPLRGVRDEALASAIESWLGAFALLRPGAPRLIFSLEPESGGLWKMTLRVRTERGVSSLRNALSDDVLRALHYISGFFPEVKDLVDKGALRISQEQTLDLITKTGHFIELAGGRLALPKNFVRLNQIAVKRRARAKDSITSFIDMSEIVEFDWIVSVGKGEISLEEFERLVRDKVGLVRVRGDWVFVEPAELRGFIDRARRLREGLSGVAALVAGDDVEADRAVLRFLERLRRPSEFPLPKDLKAKLRPYQVAGFRWLVNNLVLGACPCIADEMGLGKTVQVISALLHLKRAGLMKRGALVVCPASLLHNWEKELRRFAPSLSCEVYHGQGRSLKVGADVIITTYGMVREDERLRRRAWSVVIADEAQNIKNPQAQQTRSLKSLKSDLRIAMTGTPIENSLQDLWSIMDFLVPGYLGPWNAFYERFAKPIQKYDDEAKKALLRKAVAPLILRRLKTDPEVAPDLPEKIEKDYYCPLTPEQASLYQAVVNEGLSAVSDSSGIQRKGAILSLITRLKKICNHPGHFDPMIEPDPSRSGKTKALLPIIEEVLSGRESVLVFTQYREMGHILVQMVEENLGITPAFLHGGIPVPKRQELIRSFQSGRVPVAIFTLRTGGVGLNLEKASHVIHFDLWWNPAVESQATDRAHRIGQTKRVMVHRLISRGTLEEKINELLQRKKSLANDILVKGEKYFTELSDEELREIISLSA